MNHNHHFHQQQLPLSHFQSQPYPANNYWGNSSSNLPVPFYTSHPQPIINNDLAMENNQLKEQLANAIAKIAQLENTERDKRIQLVSEHADRAKQLEMVKRDLENRELELKTQEEINLLLDQENKKLQEESAENKSEVAKKLDHFHATHMENGKLQFEKQQLKAEVSQLQADKQESDRAHREELKKLQNALKEQGLKLTFLDNSLQEKNKELRKLTLEREDMRTSVDEVQEQLTQMLDKQMETTRAETENCKKRIAQIAQNMNKTHVAPSETAAKVVTKKRSHDENLSKDSGRTVEAAKKPKLKSILKPTNNIAPSTMPQCAAKSSVSGSQTQSEQIPADPSASVSKLPSDPRLRKRVRRINHTAKLAVVLGNYNEVFPTN